MFLAHFVSNGQGVSGAEGIAGGQYAITGVLAVIQMPSDVVFIGSGLHCHKHIVGGHFEFVVVSNSNVKRFTIGILKIPADEMVVGIDVWRKGDDSTFCRQVRINGEITIL